MRIPGFTAEATLSRTNKAYSETATPTTKGAESAVLASAFRPWFPHHLFLCLVCPYCPGCGWLGPFVPGA
jgi:hypothetical protein